MSHKDDITKQEEAFKKKVIFGLITISVILATLYVLIRAYR